MVFNPVAATPALRRFYAAIERSEITLKSLQAEFRRIQDEARQKGWEIQRAQQGLSEAYQDLREVQRKWVTATELARRLKAMGRPETMAGISLTRSLEGQLQELCHAMGVSPADVMRSV
jgi:ribosomal protein S4